MEPVRAESGSETPDNFPQKNPTLLQDKLQELGLKIGFNFLGVMNIIDSEKHESQKTQ